MGMVRKNRDGHGEGRSGRVEMGMVRKSRDGHGQEE
jgi:hypothetical protein